MLFRKCLAVLLFGGVVGSASAENWPAWRGPAGNGISTEQNVPTEWGPDKHVAWKLALPGPAGATPVVWGDRIFLTSVNEAGELLLMCVNTEIGRAHV